MEKVKIEEGQIKIIIDTYAWLVYICLDICVISLRFSFIYLFPS